MQLVVTISRLVVTTCRLVATCRLVVTTCRLVVATCRLVDIIISQLVVTTIWLKSKGYSGYGKIIERCHILLAAVLLSSSSVVLGVVWGVV